MEIEILQEESNVIEVQVDLDQSLLGLLVEKLNAEKSVEFAACRQQHPTVGRPTLFLRTTSKDARKLLINTIEETAGEVAQFAKAFAAIVKK